MSHEARYQEVEKAIDRLFSDTSVPAETTLRSLRTLRDHLDCLIDAVESDIDIANGD